MATYYEILGIGENATPEEIRCAFREEALQCHPDKVPEEKKAYAHEKFVAISNAYFVLVNPTRRNGYDQALNKGSPEPKYELTTSDMQKELRAGLGDLFERFFDKEMASLLRKPTASKKREPAKQPETEVKQELSEEDLKFLKKIDLLGQFPGYKRHRKKQIILKIDFGSIEFRRGSGGYGLYVITTNRLVYLRLDEKTGLRRVRKWHLPAYKEISDLGHVSMFDKHSYFADSVFDNELTEIVDVKLERGIFKKPVVTIDWVQRFGIGPFDIWTCTGLRDPKGFVRKLKELTKGDENI